MDVHQYLTHYQTDEQDEKTRSQLAGEVIAQYLIMHAGLKRQIGNDVDAATVHTIAATLTASVIAATWQKDVKRPK